MGLKDLFDVSSKKVSFRNQRYEVAVIVLLSSSESPVICCVGGCGFSSTLIVSRAWQNDSVDEFHEIRAGRIHK